MEKVYISLNIIKGSKRLTNKLGFVFNYISTTKFSQLMDFIASITEDSICPCYTFYYNNFKIDTDQPINILKKYISGGIINNPTISLTLFLKKCTCTKLFKIFSSSKTDILFNYQKDVQENQAEIESLKNELNELRKKNEELEKDIKVLKYVVKGDFVTLNKLKEAGIDNDLKNINIIKEDPFTKIIKGNVNNEQNKAEPKKDVIFEDFYDVIIDIKSVSDINCKKGWKIKMNDRGKKIYEEYKKEKVLKIGVIGNAKKGKSYILSRISKIDFPSGTSIRTEGLSIKYPVLKKFKDNSIVLLDSAGLNTPVLRENEIDAEMSNELAKEKSNENKFTEYFLQNYIINYSNILILVVGILTFSEQKLIDRIKTEIRRSKIDKPLYIIHNLMTYEEIKQVKDYIKKFLLKSATFKLVKGHNVSKNKGIYYHEENSNPKIFHLIYAKDKTNAGIYYNTFTINFLENSYQQQVTDITEYDVIESVKKRFVELSKEIIEKTDNIKEENFEINENGFLILKNIEEIKLKKFSIDEFGFSNLKRNGFVPKYNYYYKDKNKIIIIIEAPGNCSLGYSIDISGEYTIIRLSGNKIEDKEPKKKEDNIDITREFGQFNLDIPLKSEEYILSNKPPIIANKYGLFIISFELDNKRTFTGYSVKEIDEI